MREEKSQGVPLLSDVKKAAYKCAPKLKILSRKFQSALETYNFPLYFNLHGKIFCFLLPGFRCSATAARRTPIHDPTHQDPDE